MKYYISKALFPVVYLVITALSACVAICLPNNLLWLKIILGVLNIGVYTYLVAFYSFKMGEEGIKVRMSNDNIRREIVRTGKLMPLKVAEEYKPWKGVVIGAISCVPLVVLWIVHLIIIAITGEDSSVVGGITILLYMVVVLFFNLNVESIQGATAFYYTALFVPYMIILSGVFYYLGARKANIQSRQILEKQKQIYGEKS